MSKDSSLIFELCVVYSYFYPFPFKYIHVCECIESELLYTEVVGNCLHGRICVINFMYSNMYNK